MRLWRRPHSQPELLPEPLARFMPGSEAAYRFHEGLRLGTRSPDEATLDLGVIARRAVRGGESLKLAWVPRTARVRVYPMR
jgi:hypothetical protein